MSSEDSFIQSLTIGQTYLYQIGGPILLIIGSMSCILSLIVFMKKKLRKNPCSIYLIAFNTSNFLLIYTSLLQSILVYGYQIYFASYNLSFCRFNIYTAVLFDILSPFYLFLASIDRVLVTSANALTRQRSTRRLAYICIFIGTIFWILFHIHALISSKIIEVFPNYFICYFDSGTYLVFISYYSLIVKVILVPLSMIILGLWTLKNIRSTRRAGIGFAFSTTTTRVPQAFNSSRAKDRQFIRMWFIDVSVYIIFSLMLSIVIMYQQITQDYIKSSMQKQMELFLMNIGAFSYYIPFCSACYTNLLVSKTFRNEIKNIFLCQ